MKHILALEEPLNPEIQEISEFIKEYNSIQIMKKELELREKFYKKHILETLKEQYENNYDDGKYRLTITSVTTNRDDSEWIKDYFEKNNIEIPKKTTSYDKLNLKVLK